MKYGTPEYSLNEAKKQIDKALSELSKVRQEIGGIQEVKKLPSLNFMTLSSHFKGSYYSSFDPTRLSHVEQAFANFKKFLEEKKSDLESIHNFNLPAIENNKQTRKKICDFMATIGIPEDYSTYEYPTPRHKTRQHIKKKAGFCSDIERMIPISDGYDSYARSFKEAEERITQEYNNFIAAIKKSEQEAAKIQEEKNSLMELARFQVKYETTGDWNEILDVILEKDKYLRLGHCLLKNREDWNDGYSYAECGLNGFDATTEEDSIIETELWNIINNFDVDGRNLRDAKFGGYDYLFSKVEENLYKDYELAKSKISDY